MRNNQSPSMNSIYHNALPYYVDRLDVCLLEETEVQFAAKIIHAILKGDLQIQFDATGQTADKLRHLYFESRNFERTRGAKTLGIGYPLYIETFESELIMAPAFIWHISLDPSPNRVNSWILKHQAHHPVFPNYQLIRHIEKQYKVEILDKYEAFAMQGKLNHHSLQTMMHQLTDFIQFENEIPPNKIIPCPNIDKIGEAAKQKNIRYSSVLGLYPSQSPQVRAYDLKPEEIFVPNTLTEAQEQPVINYLSIDNYQASAIEKAQEEKIAIIEGESSTGKTQTLVNFLINALDNGKKCLVVSERVPSLKKAQALLAKTGINQFNFLLDDAVNDKPLLLEILRVAAAGIGKNIEYSAENYHLNKQQYLRVKHKLDKKYRAVKGNIFGSNNWTATVGIYLEHTRIEGKELLGNQLNPNHFDFSYQEYTTISEQLDLTKPLYQKIKTYNHPLNNLHRHIFIEKDKKEGLDFVQTALKSVTEQALKLQHRFLSKTERYALSLREHYEKHFEKLDRHQSLLEDKIEEFTLHHGDDFSKSTHSGKGLFNFSRKGKDLVKAKDFIAINYLNLVKTFEDKQYFEFQFGSTKEGYHILKVKENLLRFNEALQSWKHQIQALVQDEILRLNSKTVHQNLGFQNQIINLESALDEFLEQLNELKLFEQTFDNKTLTILQRQKYLNTILDTIDDTKRNLRDFEDFHDWQNNWLQLPKSAQSVIISLIKVKANNWNAAFTSWYTKNILLLAETSDLPLEDELIGDFVQNYHRFRPLILNRIGAYWQEQQSIALRAMRQRHRKSYQLIFGKSNQEKAKAKHLYTIFSQGLDAITATLPVLFVTPQVAEQVIPYKEGYFDYLIFDEANRFSVETAIPIAKLGQQMLIFGSNNIYGNETSLLQYAKESTVPSTVLKNRYEMPKVSNAEKKKNNGLHEILSQFPPEFSIENVEGRFHEKTGINDVEAQHIVRLLNQIERTPKRTYPSVGIVCFTLEQRDHIAAYLLKIKQQNSEGADKIAHLERNGMGVFHIDELYGQHFDVLIVSLTVGSVNLKGSLTKKMMFFNTPEGVSHLKLLIHKSPKTLYVIHSIPDSYLDNFIKSPQKEGTYLLSNFIKSGDFAQKMDKEGLKTMAKVIGIQAQKLSQSNVFMEEVHQLLRSYFGKNRFIKNVSVDELTIPLVILPLHDNEPPVALIPDGFFAHSSATSYVWEQNQQQLLQKNGYRLIPVWSTRWWKSPKQEARKLASLIIKQDNIFEVKEEALKK